MMIVFTISNAQSAVRVFVQFNSTKLGINTFVQPT